MYSANVLVPAFALPGQWFRGSLHVHSTASDGERTPDEVLAWYRERGYHFVALTDHDVPSPARSMADDFITLSGIEVEGVDPDSGLYHLLGLGLRQPPDIGVRQVLPLQEAIRRVEAASRLVAVAHPYWSGQKSADLDSVEGYFALEVYNGGCEVDDCKGLSAVHWDDLLAAGRRPWGLAVDDAHWRDGTKDAGLGWVWVKAPVLTAEAILDALERGAFYASSGPRIEDFVVQDGLARVRCSPAVAVDFVGSGPYSRRISAPAGGTLTAADYRLRPEQGYLRIAVGDAQGRWAWSNPIFLDGRAG